ncbi:MAG: hypothetical protein A3G18_13475 [Rhodospirillales bacterium RIFCSPLOWO2_12_FULL_58_28]|nr:MAG: hypothetical protein A3H92_13330 [Rhodospirillales bacterium RIFCSPLOWO2_02_FULL_58_16]OHC78583.1 MAG: hypothetical protein A3G18_13475 [Rhodospirillales bacterium RIFCSPLOWO2_12_FULL_58_28]
MSTRVASFSANQQLINLLMRGQQRMQETQVQITSEKVSQDYAGIAPVSERLVNIENSTTLLKQFKANNDMLDLDMNTVEVTLDGIQKTVADFRDLLNNFQSGDMSDETQVKNIQEAAFRAMTDMQTNLNIDVGGKYLFSGARISSIPVDMELTSLGDFQTRWTGNASNGTLYPVTRGHNVHPKLTATAGTPWDGVNVDTTARDYGVLSFAAGTSITAATAGKFANIPVGGTITIAGTAGNNGTYTVSANNGTTITTVEATALEAGVAAATVAMATYPTSGFGTLAFANVGVADTITASRTGSFGNVPVGSKITITGSASNNGTFTVAANTGTVITLSSTDSLVNEAATAAPTITTDISYYDGDSQSTLHKVTEGREFSMDLNAIDPAFEKAIRAMSIIAQGVFGTAGGLDNNHKRVDDAQYLLTAALEPTSPGAPPFETEQTSSIEKVQMDIGFNRLLLDRTNKSHDQLIGFFDQRVADIENINPLDAITRLLDDQKAMEASYQAMATVRRLSLSNYL